MLSAKYVILVNVLFASLCLLQGQTTNYNTTNNIELAAISDSYLGVDNLLVHGNIYYPPNFLINGNPYLKNDSWILGAVYIQGVEYPQLMLNYNIVLDRIILNIENLTNQSKSIELIPDFIDSVKLGKQLFINKSIYGLKSENRNYLEVLFNKEFVYLREYAKIYRKDYNQSNPQGNFTRAYTNSYVYYNDTMYTVNNKNSFINVFYKKKEVKKYFQKHSIIYKNATDLELYRLFNYCNEKL